MKHFFPSIFLLLAFYLVGGASLLQAQNEARDHFWCNNESTQLEFDVQVSTADSTFLNADLSLDGPKDCGAMLGSRNLASMDFRLEGLLPGDFSAIEGETSMLHQGDTLFLSLFNFPGLSLVNLNIPGDVLSDLYLPTAVFSKESGERWTIQRRTVRVPFPDSLAPENDIIEYPDSVDLVFEQYGERMPDSLFALTDQQHAQFKLVLTNYLRFEADPIIGSPVTIIVPLLENYEIRTTYGPGHVGLTSIQADKYTISPDWGELDGPQFESATIPAIDVAATSIMVDLPVESGPAIADRISVSAYPNPFNPSTTIQFNLQESGVVDLDIYTLSGQRIRSLIQSEQLGSGSHSVGFQADQHASQTFFYRLTVRSDNGESAVKSGQLTLLK